MSLHIMYDHQCSKCKAYYIPYEEGIVCPNCGFDEKEVYDIVPELANSANYQMITVGCYTPIAWWIGSFGDHIALLIFKVLDAFQSQNEKNFQEFALDYFNKPEWGDQSYMIKHVCDLSYKVFLELEKINVV